MRAKRKPTKAQTEKAAAARRLKAKLTKDERLKPIIQDRELVWPSIPLSHIENHQIREALKDALGVQAAAAKRLGVDEAQLWYRCKIEPELDAYVKSERTKLAANAETQIHALVAKGDPTMCRFVVTRLEPQTWGSKGYDEKDHGAAHALALPKRIDMSAALRALSPDEMMQLQSIVAKMERQAKDDVTDIEMDEEE